MITLLVRRMLVLILEKYEPIFIKFRCQFLRGHRSMFAVMTAVLKIVIVRLWFRQIWQSDQWRTESVKGGLEPLPLAFDLRNKRVRMRQNMVFSTQNTNNFLGSLPRKR